MFGNTTSKAGVLNMADVEYYILRWTASKAMTAFASD